ncbi:MAG: DUF1738 domain-containing protein [Planctomycetes bacterium]|nr:DUF1738 domain-containing protein [Planctomycetota bacterium]
MANTVYQIVTDRVIELLERGVVPWLKPWAGDDSCPKNLTSGKHYRGVNPFLLAVTSWCEGYESSYWLTYKQAQQYGGNIKKGEKSTRVIFYKQYAVAKRDPLTKQVEQVNIPVLRFYNVFNVQQTEGVEYPESNLAQIDFDPIERCESVVASMPNPPRIEISGHRASYQPSTDKITMPKPDRFQSAEHYYASLFHELTHSTGSKDRLARPGITENPDFKSGSYAKEELVAEMGSAFLCGHCNIESATIENTASYIQGWLKKIRSDSKLVIQSASAAQKSADLILSVTAN